MESAGPSVFGSPSPQHWITSMLLLYPDFVCRFWRSNPKPCISIASTLPTNRAISWTQKLSFLVLLKEPYQYNLRPMGSWLLRWAYRSVGVGGGSRVGWELQKTEFMGNAPRQESRMWCLGRQGSCSPQRRPIPSL